MGKHEAQVTHSSGVPRVRFYCLSVVQLFLKLRIRRIAGRLFLWYNKSRYKRKDDISVERRDSTLLVKKEEKIHANLHANVNRRLIDRNGREVTHDSR